ncbi:MAG: hypothetical protein LCH37_08555 [Bacteroidetes bacterium]|nr:hypothetical protein [Bacteroidota bacterium]
MRFWLLCCALLVSVCGIAQTKKNPFRVDGSIGVSHDYYSLTGNGIDHLKNRRPEHVTRFQVYTRFSKGKISLPFEISFNTQSARVNSSLDGYSSQFSSLSQLKTADDILRFVSNPVNRIGFTPVLGKFRFRLGTSTPYFSELVQGSISVFGAGVDYNGKRMFASVGYGISQAGFARDTLKGLSGAYRKEQLSFRLGIGRTDASFFALNALVGNDSPVKGLLPDSTVKPEQGIALSAQWRIQLGRYFFWESEAAASLYTDNTLGIPFKASDIGLPALPEELKLSASSRADLAGNGAIGFELKGFRLAAKALYVGAGYKSLGYPFLQSDRMEFTISPRLNLLRGDLQVSGSFGQRVNNLSGTKAAPMEQLIVQSNVSIRFCDWFSFSGGYGNFGTRSGILNDSFRIEQVAQNFQVSPLFNFTGKKAMHTLLFSYNRDDFADLNVLSGKVGNNQSEIYLASWNRTSLSGIINYGLAYNRFKFTSGFANLFNQSLSLNSSLRLFKKRLQLSASVGRMANLANPNQTEDQQWVLNAGVDYRSRTGFGIGLRWTNNNYLYGSARPDSRFNENTLRVSSSWQF